MPAIKRIALIILASIIFSGSAFSDEKWENVTGSIKDLNLSAIAIDPADSNIVFVGSSKRLYKSTDSGENWKDIFTVYGNGRINFIVIDKRDSETIYIATSNGLFKTVDSGNTWRRIFKGIGNEEKQVTSIAIHPFNSGMVYAGTKKGLFVSKNNGDNWRTLAGNIEVNFVAISPTHPDIFYIAAAKGIFRTTDSGKHWEKVFIAKQENGEIEDSDDDNSEVEEQKGSKGINCVAISPLNSNKIYLGTKRGVFISKDAARTWQKMSSTGLKSEQINFIILPKGMPSFIYVATKDGIFKFEEKSKLWQKLYMGITADDMNMLAFDTHETSLWSVGDGGVFKLVSRNSGIMKKEDDNALSFFANEPTAREVQKAAIKYAEVSPEKIKGWRKGAKYRSFLPQFDVSYDKTISYSKSDFWVGPYDWGLSFKWDLADLIWNPYQKDIDVRSRLMVQLRDDVLDEVTHLYYERRRLQAEFLLFPPEDAKMRMDKKIRLQELTANIDALTGGYFSRRLQAQK